MFGNQLDVGMGSKEFRAGDNEPEACPCTDGMSMGLDEKMKINQATGLPEKNVLNTI